MYVVPFLLSASVLARLIGLRLLPRYVPRRSMRSRGLLMGGAYAASLDNTVCADATTACVRFDCCLNGVYVFELCRPFSERKVGHIRTSVHMHSAGLWTLLSSRKCRVPCITRRTCDRGSSPQTESGGLYLHPSVPHHVPEGPEQGWVPNG